MRTTGLHRGNKSAAKGTFVVSIIFGVLFLVATINAILILTTLQATKGIVYDAAVMQLLTGIGGLGIGIFLAMMGIVEMKREETIEDLWSWERGWITWGIIGFTVARGINVLLKTGYIPTVLNVSWGETLNIVLTAAIFEEALFTLGISTLLYLALKQALEWKLIPQFGRETAEWIIILITCLVVSSLFGEMHIGAGYTAAQLMYTKIFRFVATLIYLRCRNVMAPVGMHMANNYFLLVLGI